MGMAALLVADMDERTRILTGIGLLIVGGIVVLLYALPASFAPVSASIPALLAIAAAVGMAAGTLLIGTSGGSV